MAIKSHLEVLLIPRWRLYYPVTANVIML